MTMNFAGMKPPKKKGQAPDTKGRKAPPPPQAGPGRPKKGAPKVGKRFPY